MVAVKFDAVWEVLLNAVATEPENCWPSIGAIGTAVTLRVGGMMAREALGAARPAARIVASTTRRQGGRLGLGAFLEMVCMCLPLIDICHRLGLDGVCIARTRIVCVPYAYSGEGGRFSLERLTCPCGHQAPHGSRIPRERSSVALTGALFSPDTADQGDETG
jgi:hypothetical protein